MIRESHSAATRGRTRRAALTSAAALLFGGGLLAFSAAPAAAFEFDPASVYEGAVVFGCTAADVTGTGSHTLDRDNTGEGQEALLIEITDGFGTMIHTFEYRNALGTYGAGIGTFTYTTPPAANPLTFTLTSLAGNGLEAQVDYVASGSCDEIPTRTVVALTDLEHEYDGLPHPATVTTEPEGVAVQVLYDGSADAPVEPGSYAVEATITDPAYISDPAVTTGTLVILPPPPTLPATGVDASGAAVATALGLAGLGALGIVAARRRHA